MSDTANAVCSKQLNVKRRRLISAVGTLGAMTGLGALTGTMSSAYAASPVDLSKVSLVLGEQAGGLRALVDAAGALDGVPYKYKWANFQGAAPLFEAQRAGAVDLAPAGDLPVLAAALGDPELKIVLTTVGSGASLGIVVPPRSSIKSVADLKGKTVIVSSARGSISQYQLYGALAQVGLSRSDVNVKFVLPIDAFTAFQSGSIDVWATFDPYYGSAVAAGARVIRDGIGINSGLAFITSPTATVNDPGKRAALVDVLLRIRRAGQWAIDHPDAYAQTYATLTRLPLSSAKLITGRVGLRFRGVTPSDVATLQKVADTAFGDTILPRRIDVPPLCATDLGLPTSS